ncbi:thiamine-phosphate kinase [Corynebacterium renale]|uniref:Thiamine-monophosphate kinase n=1 Tax=Corynebacterium renale TaxID=1724 RepID=A0A2A9DR33_9CORY|nr:thiamine-phosphate kinase [Corynebacterium renale]PFG28826.1 thiamine-phosphate kinase [Corynebacterium renale]SQI25686.1 thiamine monophosphate kinase [Corynebacterium renale]
MKTLGDIGEHGAIDIITRLAPSALNGDDAAVLYNSPPNSRTVVTTDSLVLGRHFRLDWSSPEDIGHKAIVQNFADIEAMGARPVAAVMALNAPPSTPVSFIEGLARGIHDEIKEFAAELVGGDITASDEIIVTITAIGSLGGSAAPLNLNAAKPGQKLVASGVIGHSAAGLALLQHFEGNVPEEFAPLVHAHLRPRLQPSRGMIARATGATCATDNSDGLLVDLETIATRSGVSINLNADAIAPTDLMHAAGEATGIDPWQWVYSGGEDHTLMATTHHDVPSGFRHIGDVGRGNTVTVGGKTPAHTGWVSF